MYPHGRTIEPGGGEGVVPYSGLYGEAPPVRGAFLHSQYTK